MLFWIVLILLGVIAAWCVVLPAIKSKPTVDESRQALNVKIFNQRMSELEADKAADRIDEEDFEALKVELERNFLRDMSGTEQGGSGEGQGRLMMIMLVLVVPILSLVIYKTSGYKQTIPDWFEVQSKVDPLIDKMVSGQLNPEELKNIPMSDFVYGLQRRAQSEKDIAQLWYVLGNTYLQLQVGDHAEQARLQESGAKALRRAYYLEPDDTEYALSYTQVLINQNQGLLDIESRKILNKLLQQHPDLPSAIMMIAMASYQAGDYQIAIDGWQRLLELGRGQAGHGKAETILRKSIAQAKAKLAASGGAESAQIESASTPKYPAATKPQQQLTIQVDLEDNATSMSKSGFLMVYAQAEQGPPMPLAVKKISLPTAFPLQVTLSDADAMMAAMKLSQFEAVKITARLSQAGKAMKSSGEWFGELRNVSTKNNQQTLQVLINQQVP
ncbi:MAG: c-type cytochrome biogenesis protein CcmI [Pseudomonadales bacterium]|nr:c-type cytochrome biogenesis protein CcmI [Pseudomonadales bacterium]